MNRFDSIDPTRLRWFTAVAEELHFARAASSLKISRQRLSRTVIDLEEELGTKLFVPGAQPTQLTDDGRALLAQAPALLASAEVVAVEPESAAAALRVGFVPGVTVSKWTRIWAERFPDIPLETVPVAAADQLEELRAGRVDMCFVRLPIDRDGLDVIPLYREVPVVVVPKDHPISVFTEVGTADLADERMQEDRAVDDAAVTLEMVAAGVGLAIVPHSIARLHARRDLVYRTVADAPDTEIALAWLSARTAEAVEDFIGVVRGRSERSSRAPARAETSARGAKSSGGRATAKKSAPARQSPKKAAKRRGR